MNLLLVRHGETSHNLLGTEGSVGNDAKLTETGKKQVKTAASIIEPFKPTIIYSSPYKRCLESAEIIARNTVAKVIIDSKLAEFNMGDWSELKVKETKRLLQENNAWDYSPAKYKFKVPGGESWEDVSRRVSFFLGDVHSKYGGNDTVVVVSHNATLRAFIGIMRGLPFDKWFGFKYPNAAVSAYRSLSDQYEELFINKVG